MIQKLAHRSRILGLHGENIDVEASFRNLNASDYYIYSISPSTYGTDDLGFESRQGQEVISLLQIVQSGSGIHPIGIGVISRG